MDNKRQRENFLVAAGIGVLAGAVGYGLYSYFSSGNKTENHQSYSSNNRERKINFAEKCPICFEPMSNSTTFACQHSFHKKCIEQWQEFNKTCPLCRAHLD